MSPRKTEVWLGPTGSGVSIRIPEMSSSTVFPLVFIGCFHQLRLLTPNLWANFSPVSTILRESENKKSHMEATSHPHSWQLAGIIECCWLSKLRVLWIVLWTVRPLPHIVLLLFAMLANNECPLEGDGRKVACEAHLFHRYISYTYALTITSQSCTSRKHSNSTSANQWVKAIQYFAEDFDIQVYFSVCSHMCHGCLFISIQTNSQGSSYIHRWRWDTRTELLWIILGFHANKYWITVHRSKPPFNQVQFSCTLWSFLHNFI